MKRSLFFLALLAASKTVAGKEAGLGLEVYLRSSNLSQPVPIKANFDDWQTDDYRAGDKLYSKHIARTGLTYRGFSLGYSQQIYYYLNFSPDTARLHYLDKNDRLSNSKDVLALELYANNAEGTGVYAGYGYEFGQFSIAASFSYLSLRNIMYGEAKGAFDPSGLLNNRSNLYLDYAYHEDKIFDRPVEAPEGRGITVDMRATWQWRGHELHLAVEELYSLFKWKSAPASVITGKLDELGVSDQAVLKYRHFHADIRQHLPRHSELSYRYRWPAGYSIVIEWETLDQQSWEKLAVGWKGLQFSLDPNDGLWGVSVRVPYVTFELEADSLDADRSRALNVVLFSAWHF